MLPYRLWKLLTDRSQWLWQPLPAAVNVTDPPLPDLAAREAEKRRSVEVCNEIKLFNDARKFAEEVCYLLLLCFLCLHYPDPQAREALWHE